MTFEDPFEPLAESAPLAWARAPDTCPRDADGRSCAAYHGVWQYLRLLGVISSVRTNTDFLLKAFRDAAGGHPGLTALITGSADYSLLAHLIHACDRDRRDLSVTVIDRCPTAVWLNQWYADRLGRPVDARCADVLDWDMASPVELICTHNFLGRFDDAGRQRLVARWHALLRPGGRVVTTMRIRPGCREAFTGYTDEQARALGARVADLARTRPDVDVDPDLLAEGVYRYALGKRTHVIASDEAITRLFVDHGFDLEQADEAGMAERLRDRPSSTAGLEAYRLRIVARKR